MDWIVNSTRLLNKRSWLFFRLYRDPTANNTWKSRLDWYHETLINTVRPIVQNNPDVYVTFFTLYGPEPHQFEDEIYERRIDPPAVNLMYIRLRIAVKRGKKNSVKNAFTNSFNNNRNLVWNYETMVTFDVRRDLGQRYGSSLNNQTLQFIRYWDAACRYILSILVIPGNWKQGVDVWGVPHLVNNSIGSWLRQDQICPVPNCNSRMYMNTIPLRFHFSAPVGQMDLPAFVFVCSRCNHSIVIPSNI